MKFQKTKKDFLVFENLGKLSWILGLEIIWNIHRKSLRQKEIDLLTSARGKFGPWKMAEKIKTCDRRRIDGGQNVVYNIGPNFTVVDVGLRSGDVASSYSRSVFTDNVGIFLPKMGLRKKGNKKKVERRIWKVLCINQKGFLPMNLSNPKGESFDTKEIEKG